MVVRLSEDDINRLLEESKHLPDNYQSRIQLRSKRGHRGRELDITGVDGSQFRIILRQSNSNALDFSVIFAFQPPNANEIFRLRRYNGRSHEHTNALERETFYEFHIHEATMRYQQIGAREDTYATPTDRFADVEGAVECMMDDCGFDLQWQRQGRLL